MGNKSKDNGFNNEQRSWFERCAKEEIEEANGEKIRNVFISFSSDDLDEVNLLRGQAKNENSNIEFNDYSLKAPFNSKDADYIKRGIREQIRQSSVTVVYLSDKTADSEWVDWEIQESIAMGKGVLAMHKGDTPPKQLPKAINEHNIDVLPWNQQLINNAIQEKAENR